MKLNKIWFMTFCYSIYSGLDIGVLIANYSVDPMPLDYLCAELLIATLLVSSAYLFNQISRVYS